ncbi:hypothetical protein MM300_19190 [Evansella sp. LMS18]|uniref:hypothetical protein n=1 Tax=Evansella sp. LMS18 TaxID=2924033 RepID=UPI0020D0F84F|nr:hypothetical protein [Evansella sp. LMS18]UTR09981.1 hypothetical protein MM300_19190 [Evansella sp. LMS18]
MPKLQSKLTGLSILIGFLLVMAVPGNFLSEGMGRYVYGYPFTTVTIYQREAGSTWFGTNFFSGNDGLLIDPMSFALNILIIYWMIRLALKIFNNMKTKLQA